MEAIKLWLDSYNDLYSDFDSRHFEKRRVSEDFVEELRRALKDTRTPMEDLILYLPSKERQVENEPIITKKLQSFFLTKYDQAKEKYHRKKLNGFKLLALGLCSMILHAWIDHTSSQPFILSAAKVLLEPAGWFMIWVGMDYLFYEVKTIKKEMFFYESLKNGKLKFDSES